MIDRAALLGDLRRLVADLEADLAGAMHALRHRAEIVEWVESWVFNSDKCFAVFRP